MAEVEVDPDAYKDKCLRVDLRPGEVFDMEIDCLQLTIRKPEEELTDEAVVLGDFDLMALFKRAFEVEGVPEPFREKVLPEQIVMSIRPGDSVRLSPFFFAAS